MADHPAWRVDKCEFAATVKGAMSATGGSVARRPLFDVVLERGCVN